MSVVLITPTDYEALRNVSRHLRAQTAKRSLEIILVASSASVLKLDQSDMIGFHGFQVVEIGPIIATGNAWAAGVRASTAPIVVYLEEHSYPAPDWAEGLIRRHSGPWAGVGSLLENANPETLTSWAHLYTDFGPWLAGKPAEAVQLAGHHTAYKRAALLEFGESLDRLLETDLILNDELRARGHRLYFEPAARSYHLNCSRLNSFLWSEYHGGRLFGSARAKQQTWSSLRRALYIGGLPLIPFVRLRRVVREIRQSGRRQLLPNILLPVMAGLIGHSLGEAMGYAFGPGDAAKQRATFELDRRHHVKEKRPDLADTPLNG